VRIALVTDYYLPTLGGVQTAVKAQREALVAAGHDVTVFCPLAAPSADDGIVALPVSPVFRPDGYPFTWPPRRAAALLSDEFRLRGIDVVHTHSEMFAALAAICAAEPLGLPVVHTMHGRIDVYTAHVLPAPRLTTPLLAALHSRQISHRGIRVALDSAYTSTRSARLMWRLMLAQARASAHVIVPSAHFARKLGDQGIATPVTVLSNGLEPSVLAHVGTPARRSLDAGERMRVMWVGRLSPEKRPDVFVEAARAFGEEVEAHLYGEGGARRAVERIGAPVTLHGSVPQTEVLEAMRRSQVLVSSSWDFDNQPMVLLEAIASGLPVVFCDPDLAEVVPVGGGFLTPTPDAAGIARTIAELRADPLRLQSASRAMSAARDSVGQDIDPTLEIYRSVLAASR
jgi:glycosyltransferase involved in cell wall biosynthesis